MATAGFIVVFMKSVTKPPEEEAMAALKDIITKGGGQLSYMGACLKVYEGGRGCPPNGAIIKFDSKKTAVDLYESKEYQDLLGQIGVGTTIKRDVRIIEAPADTFTQGKAYWIAQLENIIDKERFAKYFNGFVAANEKGFEIALDDGSTTKANLTIKAAAPSTYYEEAKDLVPEAGKGADFFPGANTEAGLVIIAEMETHEIGGKLKDCADYKNALLASLDQTYTDEEAFIASEAQFRETVFRRDVRIFGF